MKKIARGAAVVLSAVLILTFTACSSAHGNSTVKGTVSSAAYSGNSSGFSDNGAVKRAEPSSPSPAKAATARKIIKNGEMSLTTSKYDQSIKELESTVAGFGGYVQSSSTQGEGASGSRTATFAVRVPTDQFSAFLDSVGKIGKVVRRNVTGNDVTEQYVDTQTRLSTLQAEHARLLELLKKATVMEDIIKLEDKMTSIETQIEQYSGSLKKLDSLVDLSTVNITISEASQTQVAAGDSFGGGVANIFNQSVKALGTTLQFICYFIIAILPFAVVIGAVLLIVLLIRRRMGKSFRKKKEEKQQDDEPKDEN